MAIDANENYTLKGSQITDLANKIKAKANFTLTDTDPGEGVPLAEGEFIGVYDQPSPFPVQTSNIADSAVTTDKIGALAVTTDRIGALAVTTAKLANTSVTSGKIDWSSFVTSGTYSDTNGGGYIDFGTIRIQWMNKQWTGLNTGAGGYNVSFFSWPASWGNSTYTAVACPITDVGNIAGAELKVVNKTTTQVQLNYNHTGSIGSSSMNVSVIGIGKKP